MTSSLIAVNHRSVSLTVAEIWPNDIFRGQFDLDLISQGHSQIWQMIQSDIISYCSQSQSYKSVSLTVTEIWPIENFEGQFDLGLISQGHHKTW